MEGEQFAESSYILKNMSTGMFLYSASITFLTLALTLALDQARNLELDSELELNPDWDQVLTLARALDLIKNITLDLVLAQNIDLAWNPWGLALKLGPARDLDLDPVLNQVLNLTIGLTLTQNLDLAWDTELNTELDSDLSQALNLDPALDRKLSLTLVRALNQDLSLTLAQAWNIDSFLTIALDSTLDLELESALDQTLSLILVLTRNLELDLNLELQLTQALARSRDVNLARAIDMINNEPLFHGAIIHTTALLEFFSSRKEEPLPHLAYALEKQSQPSNNYVRAAQLFRRFIRKEITLEEEREFQRLLNIEDEEARHIFDLAYLTDPETREPIFRFRTKLESS